MVDAEKLKRCRTLYGDTQKQFGERIGYTQSWVSQMENGVKPISPRLVRLIEYMIKDYASKHDR